VLVAFGDSYRAGEGNRAHPTNRFIPGCWGFWADDQACGDDHSPRRTRCDHDGAVKMLALLSINEFGYSAVATAFLVLIYEFMNIHTGSPNTLNGAGSFVVVT
jgi:hypothetical protein